MPPTSPILNVMTKAAFKTARSLLRDFGEVENLQVSLKGPSDFVTSADLQAEKILHQELSRARPKFGFLMEESGEAKGADPDNRWVVDPLDGTINFMHAIPHFAISIAHEYKGAVVAGVVYDPLRDEMFAAEKGMGAYCNDRRLRISARKDLADSVLATSLPSRGRKREAAYLAQLETVMDQCAGVRRFGSAALDLAYVAAGRYEGFWETGLSRWDIAAGLLIVREAGGHVSEFDGRTNMLESGNILATNGHLHESLSVLLQMAARSA